MTKMKILVAAHKECPLPSSDIFLPIQVGRKIAEKKLNMQGDDDGENISDKNENYCELTAMFWAWKNLKDTDIIGLYHYRRYFNFNSRFTLKETFIIKDQYVENCNVYSVKIDRLLKKYDIILAKPILYPYNLKVDYAVNHLSSDYFVLKEVVQSLYPEYSAAWEYIMENNNMLSHYNMFISNWSFFNDYCTWLFSILDEVKKKISISNYDDVQKRIFGYMGERLLNVYVQKNTLQIKYLPIYLINNEVADLSNYRSFLRRIKREIAYQFWKKW